MLQGFGLLSEYIGMFGLMSATVFVPLGILLLGVMLAVGGLLFPRVATDPATGNFKVERPSFRLSWAGAPRLAVTAVGAVMILFAIGSGASNASTAFNREARGIGAKHENLVQAALTPLRRCLRARILDITGKEDEADADYPVQISEATPVQLVEFVYGELRRDTGFMNHLPPREALCIDASSALTLEIDGTVCNADGFRSQRACGVALEQFDPRVEALEAIGDVRQANNAAADRAAAEAACTQLRPRICMSAALMPELAAP